MKPKEDWIIVENTHEPLIDRETFNKVQALAQQKNDEYFEKLGRFTHLETTENILKGWSTAPTASVRWYGTRM